MNTTDTEPGMNRRRTMQAYSTMKPLAGSQVYLFQLSGTFERQTPVLIPFRLSFSLNLGQSRFADQKTRSGTATPADPCRGIAATNVTVTGKSNSPQTPLFWDFDSITELLRQRGRLDLIYWEVEANRQQGGPRTKSSQVPTQPFWIGSFVCGVCQSSFDRSLCRMLSVSRPKWRRPLFGLSDYWYTFPIVLL